MAKKTAKKKPAAKVSAKKKPKKPAPKPAKAAAKKRIPDLRGKRIRDLRGKKHPDTAPKPVKAAPKQPPVKVAKPADEPQPPVQPEVTWVVWQDARGIWAGTLEEYKQSKRPETIVCDVFNTGIHRDYDARQRAIHLARLVRQTYSDCVKPWLQYDDFAQAQRVKEWEERSRLAE